MIDKEKIKLGNINPKEIWKRISDTLASKNGWVLAVAAAGLFLYCGYLWYMYIGNPHWNEDRKQEYMSSKEKETVFDQKKFDSSISEIQERKIRFQNKIQDVPNIFGLK